MASDYRDEARRLEWLKRLEAEPHRYGFYQAIRRLESIYRDKPRVGHAQRPRDEAVRLGQTPSMAFAPSTLASFQKNPRNDLWQLRTYFFGLLGPNGALPLHLTEYAYERVLRHNDQTFNRFLDVFHHRMATMFYRAWADAQPTAQYDRPESDHFAMFVGALIGIGLDSMRNRDEMPDNTKLHFAGHLSCQTRHTEGLQAILRSFLMMPAQISEFLGHWLELPEDCRLNLGRNRECATLGQSALLGRRVWDRQQSFRIELGPMSLVEYSRMLPGGESLKRLTAIVKNYVGLSLRWDVRLIMKSNEVPRITLGRQGQLGWTAWLASRQPKKDAGDLILKRGPGAK